MLIRANGARSGIKEYLEKGQMKDRFFDRDQLDHREILYGDLGLIDDTINNLSNDGEKYFHFTLAFKEDSIPTEKLSAITQEFRDFYFKAYTVDEFLPQYKSWGNITISQLINQTSGIYDYTNSFLWWTRLYLFSFLNWNPTELLAIADGKSYFEPSHGWHYSNTNYVILGLIIEKITQQKLSDYFTKNFLQTRHMSVNHTKYILDNPSGNLKNNLAHGYYNNGVDMTNINTSWLQSAGAMLSNANDLTKWYLFYGQQIINNKFVLSQFVDIINGKQLGDFSHIGYGFGAFMMSTPYGILFLTPGLTLGYTSLAGYLPCKDVSFSYIITNGFKRQNVHQYLLAKIIPIIAQNTSDKTSVPECQIKSQSKEIIFPNF